MAPWASSMSTTRSAVRQRHNIKFRRLSGSCVYGTEQHICSRRGDDLITTRTRRCPSHCTRRVTASMSRCPLRPPSYSLALSASLQQPIALCLTTCCRGPTYESRFKRDLNASVSTCAGVLHVCLQSTRHEIYNDARCVSPSGQGQLTVGSVDHHCRHSAERTETLNGNERAGPRSGC